MKYKKISLIIVHILFSSTYINSSLVKLEFKKEALFNMNSANEVDKYGNALHAVADKIGKATKTNNLLQFEQEVDALIDLISHGPQNAVYFYHSARPEDTASKIMIYRQGNPGMGSPVVLMIGFLQWAANHNQVNIIEKFIRIFDNFDLNNIDKNNNTLLHSAIQNNSVDVAKFLVSKKVGLNLRNKSNYDSIDQAIISGSSDIAKLLLENGALPILMNLKKYTKEQLDLLMHVTNQILYEQAAVSPESISEQTEAISTILNTPKDIAVLINQYLFNKVDSEIVARLKQMHKEITAIL